MSKHYLDILPRTARAVLDDLTKGLRAILEADLASVVVYGSAARGDYKDKTSDLDVIIILRDTSRDRLDRIANTLAIGRAAGRVDAMLLTEEEILRAADVFPLLYEDIQKCHAVLYGNDPFEGLEISPVHRRLRIEQELREAQIRLRRAVTDGRGDERALAHAVARKLRQIRFPMRALLELSGVECQSHALDIVLQKACKRFVVDSANLLRVDRKPQAAHEALTILLARAIEWVDHLDDPKGS